MPANTSRRCKLDAHRQPQQDQRSSQGQGVLGSTLGPGCVWESGWSPSGRRARFHRYLAGNKNIQVIASSHHHRAFITHHDHTPNPRDLIWYVWIVQGSSRVLFLLPFLVFSRSPGVRCQTIYVITYELCVIRNPLVAMRIAF